MPDLTRGHTYSSGDSVTHSNLNNLVGNATINDNAVTTSHIADDAVTADKIGTGAVVTQHIGDSKVTTVKIDNNAVTSEKLGDLAVTTARLNNSAVTTNKIADDAITSEKIGDDEVSLPKLTHGTKGDILYYGTSGAPARLSAGTSGQFLKTQGSGQNPTWADVPAAISAFEQVTLTGTSMVYNHSSHGTDPVVGSFGDDEAFWLVEDDNSDSMDLSLTIASTSKVKLTVDLETDTDHQQVCTSVRVQRSTDSGVTWTDMPRGDAASTRVRVAFTTQHGFDARSTGRSSWHYIDSPSSTSVRYRVIYGVQSTHKIYLNRETSYDADGDAGSVTDAEYRTTSYFLAEEILQ